MKGVFEGVKGVFEGEGKFTCLLNMELMTLSAL